MEIEKLKAKLKEKAEIYPLEEIVIRLDEVCRTLFRIGLEKLKATQKKELDLCRRKFRAKYYARQHNLVLESEENHMEGLYENKYGIIAYLLTYFWRNYPMVKFILSEYLEIFPFLIKPETREINILDVGAGVGTVPFALSHFIRDVNSLLRVRYHVVDTSRIMLGIAGVLCYDLHLKGRALEAKNWWIYSLLRELNIRVKQRFDLITLSYVLSELTKEESIKLLGILLRFLAGNGRIIIIEPLYFVYNLKEIFGEVIKNSETNAILKTVGSRDNQDFYLDMKNKKGASGFTLENFDITRSFFCFSIIGNVEENDFRFLEKKSNQPQKTRTILSYVLFMRKIGEKYYELGVVGREYVGLVYVRGEVLPLEEELEGQPIKAIIHWNMKYGSYEAFYIELSEGEIPFEKRIEYFREARQSKDKKKGVFKGTIVEVNNDNVTIDSEKYGHITAQWNDSVKIPPPNDRYNGGDNIIAFVGYSKRLEKWFVNFVEKL